MSITFYVKPFSTHPAWDAVYLKCFLAGSINLGPFHAAFGQIPTDATLSVTILPDDDTRAISELLEVYQKTVLLLPMPPTSAYDLHVGTKIKEWEDMYYSSEAKLLPIASVLMKKLSKEGGLQCLARVKQHRKECKALSMPMTPLPLDFAEGQVLAKLSLVTRLRSGLRCAHWDWRACRSAYEPWTTPYVLNWMGRALDESRNIWHSFLGPQATQANDGIEESTLTLSRRRVNPTGDAKSSTDHCLDDNHSNHAASKAVKMD